MNETRYIVYITIPFVYHEIKVEFYMEGNRHLVKDIIEQSFKMMECEYNNVDKIKEFHETKGLTYEIIEQ